MKMKILIALSVAAMLNIVSTASAVEVKILNFGLITDTHVSDKADQADTVTTNATARYFTGAQPKIEAFAQAMNKGKIAFVAELGDFTDNPADATLPYEARKAVALGFVDSAEAKLAQFKGPRYHVFGNHDTDQMSKQEYLSHLTNTGIPRGASYYSFDKGGLHFVVLDAGFKGDGNGYSGVPGSAGSAYSWQDANIPPEEMRWLKADLEATRLPVIVLGHQFLNPAEQVDPLFDPAHSVRNAAEVRALLESNGRVLAVFAGHYHDGGYQQLNGISYVGLQASAAYGNDVGQHNQYATVSVRAEGSRFQVVVTGHGQQKSYVISKTLR